MYFDVDSEVEIPESHAENVLTAAAREFSRRRGRVLAKTKDVLVFSAPFWWLRSCYLVPQLPLGVSNGIIEVRRKDEACLVRFRVSFFWFRLNIVVIALFAAYAVAPVAVADMGGGNKGIWLTALVAVIAACPLGYWAAVVETRRFFKNMLSQDSGF